MGAKLCRLLRLDIAVPRSQCSHDRGGMVQALLIEVDKLFEVKDFLACALSLVICAVCVPTLAASTIRQLVITLHACNVQVS